MQEFTSQTLETRIFSVSLGLNHAWCLMGADAGIKKAELVKQQHVQLGQARVYFVNSDVQLARGCQEK